MKTFKEFLAEGDVIGSADRFKRKAPDPAVEFAPVTGAQAFKAGLKDLGSRIMSHLGRKPAAHTASVTHLPEPEKEESFGDILGKGMGDFNAAAKAHTEAMKAHFDKRVAPAMRHANRARFDHYRPGDTDASVLRDPTHPAHLAIRGEHKAKSEYDKASDAGWKHLGVEIEV